MRWTIADLAHRAGIGEATVKVLEAADGVPGVGGGVAQTLAARETAQAASLAKVRKAFGKAGVTFLPHDGKAGVGVHGKIKMLKAVPISLLLRAKPIGTFFVKRGGTSLKSDYKPLSQQ
jgi:hypothetical protein